MVATQPVLDCFTVPLYKMQWRSALEVSALVCFFYILSNHLCSFSQVYFPEDHAEGGAEEQALASL